ncbi:MAG TPA: bifunctional YncE family protein/alkaline phosphatase family protein [Bryobacteraceae bacterium]|nr:bifunctional YncE family protein/alkaline phosphatase family protein [Bryobacteraceae bacterium]
MRKSLPVLLTAALLCAAAVLAQKFEVFPLLRSAVRAGKQVDGSLLVVTQQLIRPWGEQTFLPGRPVDLAFDSNKSLLAVLNMESIQLVDGGTGVPQGEFKTKTTSYCGIAFRPGNHEIWASETTTKGTDSIFIGKLNAAETPDGSERIALPGHAVPAGIVFSPDGDTAYIALNRNNTIAIVDARTRSVKKEIPVGLAPFSVALSPAGDRLYVSNRGGHAPSPGQAQGFSSGAALATDKQTGAVLNGTVSVVDVNSGAVREVTVGRAPTGLALSPDGRTLAVANSHSDSITLIDTAKLTATAVSIPTWPEGLLGSEPVAVAFAPKGDRLYVAAATNNAVVVLDKKNGKFTPVGAVPAGWFPDAIALDREGNLRILNIKGRGNTDNGHGAYQSRAFEGSLLRIPAQLDARLAAATREVRAANNPKFEPAGGVQNLESLGIHHVFLIVKENRTYDQVFGDMPQGNGDAKLVMYGRDVTPNHHALAEKYVLLDNFYATGAMSFDGHQWLEQGFVSDNVERALTDSPRGYAWNLSDALDVSPAGFFWQHSARPLDVRVGGVLSLPAEWDPKTQTARDITEDDLHPWAEYWKHYLDGSWPGVVGSRAAVPALASVMDLRYPVNAMKITDQIRATVVEQELAEANKSGYLPDLLVFGMTSDHTMGTDPQSPTPSAMVADNDLALGRMVEAISKSRFWSTSLILVVEDDAQNGVDHVDGHRTVALAIGPSIRHNAVDSNFYTQLSMTRTIQDIFHIEPRTHFLKAARAMTSIFTAAGARDLSTYSALKPQIPLDTMNPPLAALNNRQLWAAKRSATMDWNHVDDVPTQILNQILWWDRKGYNSTVPPTRSSLKE